VTDLVLNPDARAGYGAPVGCVLTSPKHIYPGPVGVDIKCSMIFLQLDLPTDQLNDKTVRRALINAILERTPTGPGRGQRSAREAHKVGEQFGVGVATDGASPEVLHALGIPLDWAQRCEDAAHGGHDGSRYALAARIDRVDRLRNGLEIHCRMPGWQRAPGEELPSVRPSTKSIAKKCCPWAKPTS